MGKRKSTPCEVETEFLAQLDFLRSDYDNAVETIDQQNADIRQLLALLIKENIPIPEELIDRYIRKMPKSEYLDEDLPFD